MKYAMLIAGAALAISVAVASPVSAEERFEIRVSYADLNLNSNAGADALLSRIRYAARRGCGVESGQADFRVRALSRTCARDAMADAVAGIGHPHVTARYNGSGRRAILAAVR